MTRKPFLISIPTNHTELNERIALVGSLERQLSEAKLDMEAKIALAKKSGGAILAPIAERLEREVASIAKYAAANRTSLLVGDAKSVSFSAGRIGWRMSPLRVSFLKNGAEKALAFLKQRRMKKYMRFIVEVDKEALLRDQPVVDGVKYKQEDEFFIEPNRDATKVEVMGEATVVSK